MPDHPKPHPPKEHPCNRCHNEAGAKVIFDKALGEHLCGWCWARTTIPKEDRGRRRL